MEYAAALRRQDDGGDLVDECRIPATLAPPPCNVSKKAAAAASDQALNETGKGHRMIPRTHE
jgi:hypothetical protein